MVFKNEIVNFRVRPLRSMKYQVCIVDDHAVVRSGLKALINSFANTICQWELSDGSELVQLVQQNIIPDIIILDITMSTLSGWQTIQVLKPYNIQKNIIILTYNSYNENIQQFIESDVAAFLSKDASIQEIQATIDDVIFQKAPKNQIIEDKNNHPKISGRELEFLKLICDEHEYTYEQISEIMGVHIRTVDSFRKSLFQKLEKKSKSGLVLYAIKNGLLNK
jgi:two-component system invasion response regulator UvrY